MIERPILFSAPMVQAIMEDRKTQTRRVVKPQPEWLPEVASARVNGPFAWPIGSLGQQCGAPLTRLPYGVPGDRLYVRETFRFDVAYDHLKPTLVPENAAIWFEAGGSWGKGVAGKKRVAIHMPRWASRALLEITDVRVERLGALVQDEARAEGVTSNDVGYIKWWTPGLGSLGYFSQPREAFAALWDHVNGKGAWAGNPFVWVISFKRVT